MTAETRHNADALRYVINGPHGLLEARITTAFAALIIHAPLCDGEGCDVDCDAEMMPGEDVATAYRLEGDEGVWAELRRHALEQEIADIPQPPHEPTAQQRDLAARARQVAEEMRRQGYFRTGQETEEDR